jgi:hypothetical protein
MPFFEHLANDPAASEIFNRAMGEALAPVPPPRCSMLGPTTRPSSTSVAAPDRSFARY